MRRLFPDLKEITLAVTPLDKAPLDAIAGLIDDAWRRTYGNRIRIAFSPAFLRYCAGPGPGRGFALTACADGALQGVALGLHLNIFNRQQSHEAVLTTGLCVSGDWQKRGLLELLMLRHGLELLDAGIPCSFHWRAAKGDETRDAGGSLAHAASVPLYARALKVRRAAALGGLGTPAMLGLGALNSVHAARGCFDRLPRGCRVQDIDADNAGAAAVLHQEVSRERDLSLIYTAERLAWDCTFDEDGIRGRGWVLMHQQQALAAAWGYTNPVSEKERYFSMDRLVFSPETDAKTRRAFLTQVERAVLRQFGCFAVLMPGCVCDDPPERLGYRPVKTYYVGATETGLMPEIAPEDFAGLALPLR